jgi:hypothetical protein
MLLIEYDCTIHTKNLKLCVSAPLRAQFHAKAPRRKARKEEYLENRGIAAVMNNHTIYVFLIL